MVSEVGKSLVGRSKGEAKIGTGSKHRGGPKKGWEEYGERVDQALERGRNTAIAHVH